MTAPPKPQLTNLIRRKRGEVRPVTLSFEFNGQPKDVSGYLFTVSVAKSPNSPSLYKGTTTIGDGTAGVVSLNIPALVTLLPIGNYYLEIRYLTPGGVDQVVASLPFVLEPALAAV